ncbi:glycosyltransferase family 4 protein [archaeon]|nr:glycosyltransferase family 4 protein [archaeon]
MAKKLALVYDAIYPYIKGGGEKRFYEVAKKLAKDYEIHFYGMKLWKGEDVIQKNGIYYHGICKNIPLYTDEKKRSISQAIRFGFSSFKLIKEDFDVIDCCGFPYFSLFPAKIACLIKGKPLITTWHEVWGKEYWKEYIGWKGVFGYWVEKMASKLPNKIIAVSSHTSQRLQKILKVPKEKIMIIPNGIELKDFNKIKPSKEKSDIIYTGRLLKNKNIDLLIRSINRIIKDKKYKSIKCMIVGDGPEKENLINLTKQLKLEKNIKFKGFIEKHKRVLSLIKSSKVFILPSTREGFGIVVIEANALGTPVITINHPENASSSLIKKGVNGYISEFNENDLSKKIKIAIDNSYKMGNKCIDMAKTYDWNNVIKKFEGVYR